jgi:hypothetical protein
MKKIHIYIIATFAILHLYGINHPTLDHHSHRQSDTFDIARNFSEEGSSIFKPQVGWRNEFSGVAGGEFPILNFIISLGLDLREQFLTGGKGIEFDTGIKKSYPIKKIITPGNYRWIGRGTILLFSIIGLFSFFLIVKKLESERIANYSLFALSCAMGWFYFSRSVQPDVPSVSLALLGLYLFMLYQDDNPFLKRRGYLLASGLTFCIAGLMKPPAMLLLFPGVYIAVNKERAKAFFNLDYVWFAILILIPNFMWLSHAEYLSEHYGLTGFFFLGRSVSEAASQIFTVEFMFAFIKRMAQEYTSWALSPFLVYGLYKIKESKHRLFYISWTVGFIAYAFKAGEHIQVHDYYAIPIAPLLAIVCGFGLNSAIEQKPKLKFMLIPIVLIIPIHLSQVYKFGDPYLLDKEKRLHGVVPYSAKVAVNCGLWPVHLHAIHRRGWALRNGFSLNESKVQKMKSLGLEYIILMNRFKRDKNLSIYKDQVLVNDSDLMVIKLD